MAKSKSKIKSKKRVGPKCKVMKSLKCKEIKNNIIGYFEGKSSPKVNVEEVVESLYGTVTKNVKQHSFVLDEITIKSLLEIADRYATVKDYVASRFSGINSLLLIESPDENIRNKWVENKFGEGWGIPARYWKLALSDSISGIKSEWSNTINRVKAALKENDNLSENEKSYIRYILSARAILFSVLTHKEFIPTDKMNSFNIDETRLHYIFNLIRRYIRKYKGNVAIQRKRRSFSVDADMYKYTDAENGINLEIASLIPRKRLNLPLKDKNNHKGNLKIIIKDNNTVEVHSTVQQGVLSKENAEVLLAIDKGYTSLFATNTDKEYGVSLGEMMTKETERLNVVNSKRNQIWALMKKYEDIGDIEKANRIRENNFGTKKYNSKKRKNQTTLESYINHEIRTMLKIENPDVVIVEKLNFYSWVKKLPPKIKRKLSRWVKGFIQERLDYICSTEGIPVKEINCAYTSQICSKCGLFGNRNGKKFTCSKCGTLDADVNGASNIEARYKDDEITLYTPYKEVKKILLKRIENKKKIAWFG